MQLINTGKYILKFYFSDPSNSPAWVLKTFTYLDELQDDHKQSLIDMHFKNDGADIPLAFINLAKLGLRGIIDRHQHSEAPQNIADLEKELDHLKIKIEGFIKEQNFGSERIEYCHQQLHLLEKELTLFIQKNKPSKNFFSRSKSKNEPVQNIVKADTTAKKANPTFKYLASFALILICFVFYKPISTFFWKIGTPSDFSALSSTLHITHHETQNRDLTVFISEQELRTVPYKTLKPLFEDMMNKAFDMGFENFIIKDSNSNMIAKNISINRKKAIYIFYYE